MRPYGRYLMIVPIFILSLIYFVYIITSTCLFFTRICSLFDNTAIQVEFSSETSTGSIFLETRGIWDTYVHHMRCITGKSERRGITSISPSDIPFIWKCNTIEWRTIFIITLIFFQIRLEECILILLTDTVCNRRIGDP